ncbi:MAG: DO-GTPase1 protein, partial [Thermoproteota archaeon]|nr:DO-GTPase1 protein [Thermoproteota archaeon]
DEKSKKITSQDLLQLIQLPTLAAGLNVIAFDQPNTEAIFSKYKPSDFLDVIRNVTINDSKIQNEQHQGNPVFSYLLMEFPYLLSYCKYLISIETNIDDSLLRMLAILILYFGNEANSDSIPDLKEFTFGTYAQLRNWHSVGELLTSYYYVSALQNVFPDFTQYLQKLEDEERSSLNDDSLKLGSFDNVQKFQQWKSEIPQFEDVVLYTVDFACSGKKASIPKDATIIARRKNMKVERKIEEEIADMVESKVCGWIPKKKTTESLLLVGGTASSKTTLLQSTIVQVKRAAANLGMVFETSSPLSSLLLQYYEQRFDGCCWDGATESGDRTSIQISLRQANDPNKVFHLVINDIAGEHFEEMLIVEKDYNVIQSPLSYARHVIFLFDLVAFRQLGALLQDTSDQGNWDQVLREGERHAKVGRAVADSRDLLIKLVARLVTASGGEKQLPIKRSFILVIPKCDLYVKEGMFLNRWVSNLTKAGYLKRLGTDNDSPYMSTWKFNRSNVSDEFEAALNGINEMSDQAATAIKDLSKQQIQDQETSISAERVALNIASILTYLENTFIDVKVVPVSALGKAPDELENEKNGADAPETGNNGAGGFKAKATPLFCEALLLLPMIKMGTSQQEIGTAVN